MRKWIFLFCFPAILNPSLLGQSRKESIDNFFNALANHQGFSGNVLIAEQGKVIYERSFGYADHSTRQPNTPEITFPVASISKTLTATAILQLKEKGLLNIGTSAAEYLPGFPYPEIEIKHLLSHTSGLPPYNTFFNELRDNNLKRVFRNEDFMPVVMGKKIPLLYQPGEAGNYDNVNYLVLALIIEKTSGQSYEDYIQQNILLPSGMHDTRLFPLNLQFNTGHIENFAYSHLYPHLYDTVPVRSSSIPYVQEYWHSYGFNGFGDYVSTTRDLQKYDQALKKNTILKQATLKEAYTLVKLKNGKPNPGNFGLGWMIEEDSTLGNVVYHSGAATGLSCAFLRNLSHDQVIVVFDNAHYNAEENAKKALLLLHGQEVELPRKSLVKTYANILMKHGANVAKAELQDLRKDTAAYYFNEAEMNAMGYAFMGNSNPYKLPEEHYYELALETFKLNVTLFPESWNAYDSYAEALAANGQTEEAIKMYKKSIELNPANENGKEMLKGLLNK